MKRITTKGKFGTWWPELTSCGSQEELGWMEESASLLLCHLSSFSTRCKLRQTRDGKGWILTTFPAVEKTLKQFVDSSFFSFSSVYLLEGKESKPPTDSETQTQEDRNGSVRVTASCSIVTSARCRNHAFGCDRELSSIKTTFELHISVSTHWNGVESEHTLVFSYGWIIRFLGCKLSITTQRGKLYFRHVDSVKYISKSSL